VRFRSKTRVRLPSKKSRVCIRKEGRTGTPPGNLALNPGMKVTIAGGSPGACRRYRSQETLLYRGSYDDSVGPEPCQKISLAGHLKPRQMRPSLQYQGGDREPTDGGPRRRPQNVIAIA